MKKLNGVLWGAVLIAVGVIWGLNAMGVTHLDLFFPGWWTLFIIVPSVISLITDDDNRMGSVIGIIVGVALLLASLDVFSFAIILKLVVPVILIVMGASMIAGAWLRRDTVKKIHSLEKENGEVNGVWAMFASEKKDYAGKKFNGCRGEALFGALELDLEKAKIEKDAVIKATAMFGGVKIRVPEDVNVEINSHALIGGTNSDDLKTRRKAGQAKGEEGAKAIIDPKKPTLYIDTVAVFGVVEIK